MTAIATVTADGLSSQIAHLTSAEVFVGTRSKFDFITLDDRRWQWVLTSLHHDINLTLRQHLHQEVSDQLVEYSVRNFWRFIGLRWLEVGRRPFEFQQERRNVGRWVNVLVSRPFTVEEQVWHLGSWVMSFRLTNPGVQPIEAEFAFSQFCMHLGQFRTELSSQARNILMCMADDTALGCKQLSTAFGIRLVAFDRAESVQLFGLGQQVVRHRRNFDGIVLRCHVIRLVVQLEELRHAGRRTEPLGFFRPV